MPNLLKVRLSLKGRPIRSYTFNKKTVTIGRDPTSDIFLDNTGISRQHARIERTPGGYVLEDLGSANGTLLNEQPVHQGYVNQDDVIQVGKFSLWVATESERRDRSLLSGNRPQALEGTMVIDADQLFDLQKKAREEAAIPEEEEHRATPKAPATIARSACITASIAAFSLGLLVGATVAVFLTRG